MIRLIFKNLWARRRRNGWLLTELVLVTIVTWVIIDPIVVLIHDRNIPLGYDYKALCLISIEQLSPKSANYDAADSLKSDDFQRLMERVKKYPGIDLATPVLGFCYPNSGGSSTTVYQVEGDTSKQKSAALIINFIPKTSFFETYGIKGSESSSAEQISEDDYSDKDIIFSEMAAMKYLGTTQLNGKRCISVTGNDTTFMPIRHVVKDLKFQKSWRPVPLVFVPCFSILEEDIPDEVQILIRINKNIPMESFLKDFRPWMIKNLRSGNIFTRSVRSYPDLISNSEFLAGITGKLRMNIALAIFFLINLCLGVIGTFWLQTQTRRQDIGVMLSFGFTPARIVRMLLGEGFILTSVATLAGCCVYLQYALKEGLYIGASWMRESDSYWISNFTLHFTIVSLIVYAIILFVVCIGIYVPARNISKIPPTDALRDE